MNLIKLLKKIIHSPFIRIAFLIILFAPFVAFEDFQQIGDYNVIEYYFGQYDHYFSSNNEELDVREFLEWIRPGECCD